MRLFVSIVLVSVALSLPACGGTQGSTGDEVSADTITEAQRSAVLRQMETHGINPESARFVGNNVVLGEDLVIPIAEILTQSEESVQKGYTNGAMLWGTATNLQLVFGTWPASPTDGWKAAARQAAWDWTHAQWNGQWINVNITETDTGPQLSVSVAHLSTFPLNYDRCTYAVSTWPHGFLNTAPGSVMINLDFNCGSCPTYANLSAGVMATVIRHEMGHTLGMVHPEDRSLSGVTHVPNTATGGSYATIMHASASCTVTTQLTSDDNESLFEMYGPQ